MRRLESRPLLVWFSLKIENGDSSGLPMNRSLTSHKKLDMSRYVQTPQLLWSLTSHIQPSNVPSRKEGPNYEFSNTVSSRNPLHRRICSSKPLRCFCDGYERTMWVFWTFAQWMSFWMSGLKLCLRLVTIWPILTVASVHKNALCNAQFVFAHSTARSLNSETQSVSGHRCFGIVALWRCTRAWCCRAKKKRQQPPQNLKCTGQLKNFKCLAPQPSMTPP